mmetsp:Transcript_105402/g.263791  ORF Transcript_105402/g.263791 Transcript_105402/m.263791 type:complete len:403 (+) Transcript_105402:121-1329(+)
MQQPPVGVKSVAPVATWKPQVLPQAAVPIMVPQAHAGVRIYPHTAAQMGVSASVDTMQGSSLKGSVPSCELRRTLLVVTTRLQQAGVLPGTCSVDHLANILVENWFDTPAALSDLTDDCAAELHVPLALAGALRDEALRLAGRGPFAWSAGSKPELPVPMSSRRGWQDSTPEVRARSSSVKARGRARSGSPSSTRCCTKVSVENHVERHRRGRENKQQDLYEVRISNQWTETVTDPWVETSAAKRSGRVVWPAAGGSRSIAGAENPLRCKEMCADIAPTAPVSRPVVGPPMLSRQRCGSASLLQRSCCSSSSSSHARPRTCRRGGSATLLPGSLNASATASTASHWTRSPGLSLAQSPSTPSAASAWGGCSVGDVEDPVRYEGSYRVAAAPRGGVFSSCVEE